MSWCDGVMRKTACAARTVNHSPDTVTAPGGASRAARSQSARAIVVSTHSPRSAREARFTATNASANAAYVRDRVGQRRQKSSGRPRTQSAISSA